MALFDTGGLTNATNQVLGKVTTKFQNYISSAVSAKLGDAVSKLGLKIPSQVRGILGFIFNETCNFDPLQNLMFRVTLGNATFDNSQIKAVKIPSPSFKSKAQKQNGGLNIKYPDGTELGDLTITFYESTDGAVQNFYYQWQSLIFNRSTGTYGTPNAYKRTCLISIINPSGASVFDFEFTGTWPKSISGYDMDTAGGAIITPTITFSVDDSEIRVAGSSLGSLSGIAGFVNKMSQDAMNSVKSRVKGLIGIG